MKDFKNEKLENFNKEIAKKKVAIIGLGTSNIPLIDYFDDLGCSISVFDSRDKEKIDKNVLETIENKKINYFFGEDCLNNLKGFDYIFRSPSCMPWTEELQKEVQNGAVLTSEIEQVLEKATTDGVVRPPSALAMTTGSPPSMTATQELVVPKSIPIILLIVISSLKIP